MIISKTEAIMDLEEDPEKRKNPPGFTNDTKEDRYFTVPIYKSLKIRIYKPLVTLKISLFLWMAASSSVVAYFFVFLKKRGLTIKYLLMINSSSAAVPLFEIAALAILIDKIGRTKLILILNLIFAAISMVSITLIPKIESHVHEESIFHCDQGNLTWMTRNNSCDFNESEIPVDLCHEKCYDFKCESNGENCKNLINSSQIGENQNTMLNYSLYSCFYPVDFLVDLNTTKALCKDHSNRSCLVFCPLKSVEPCCQQDILPVIYVVVAFLAMMAYINVFRFFDVTSTILVKEHNTHYGEVRFWAIVGSLIGPTLSGSMVHVATPIGEESNYAASLYWYAAICLLTALMVCKVDVRNLDPGTKMLKKICSLLKIPDVSAFFVVTFILGTSWGFGMLYRNWYLADLGADAFIFGAIGTLSALYGLPFLYTSEWFLKKIGDSNLFVLGLLAHAANFFAYSFIKQTWLSLLIELTSILTYHLLWVAVIHYCIRITPPGLTATVNSTAGSLHFNVGRITGAFFGGLLTNSTDGKFAFRILGSANIFVAVLYAVFLCFRRNRSK